MEYISTKEASKKWGITPTRITILANEGRIHGAKRVGRRWLIPVSAVKPEKLKSKRLASDEKRPKHFYFPVHYFRPNWNSEYEVELSNQQLSLLSAETAVLECRFLDAYPTLESILRSPEDIYTELGCLWNVGLCYIALNMPEDFSRVFLRIQLLLAKDFPHRNDCVIILDALKTYVESIGTVAKGDVPNTDIHYQSLPLTSVQAGYTHLSKEAIKPGLADTTLLEINLRFLKTTSSVISMEMMHCYLLGIYYLRQDTLKIKTHAEAIVKLSYDNKCYFPLVTYFSYFVQVFSPILDQYPEDFRKHCLKLVSQYDNNYSSFMSSISKSALISILEDSDYPYLYGVLMDLSNNHIASNLGVHPHTVKNRLAKMYEKLHIKTKKELREYLLNRM